MSRNRKTTHSMVAVLIAASVALSTVRASEDRPAWESLLTHLEVIGQSSGYYVFYGLAEGTTAAQLKDRLHEELKSLTAKRSAQKWLPLPGFENDDLRFVDVVALIYADLSKREIKLSYWDDVKQRDQTIATLLEPVKTDPR